MSQAATLYRLSQHTFQQLAAGEQQPFDSTTARNYAIFAGTFLGLEFILSKGQDASTVELIKEIFSPGESIGEKTNVENLPPEEMAAYYESLIPYLDPKKISWLNSFLDRIEIADIQQKYDANELNRNEVYPWAWHNDNSPDQAFNLRHLLEGFIELKTIIKQAAEEQDYIVVFVG